LIYTVLGMHKSGTTLVSQILHHSGIPMDDTIESSISYDNGNKYERQSVLKVNMDLLKEHRFTYFFGKTPEQMDTEGIFRKRVNDIIQKADVQGTDWGFKDPRVAITYPIWNFHLPEHKIIYIFRDQTEIWPRYKYKKPWYFFYNFQLCWVHLERWYVYNASIVKTLLETDQDYLVINYEALMTTDAEFERIQEFSGRKLEDKRRPDLYRSKKLKSVHLFFAEKMLKRKYGVTSIEFMNQLLSLRTENLTMERKQ
jgi:hypothetical protein